MKKIFLFLSVLISLSTFAQVGTTAEQYLSSATKILRVRGYLTADKGFFFANFTDTATANASIIDLFGGSLIRTGDSLWLRSTASNRWLLISTTAATAYTAGSGLTLSGSTFSLGGNVTSNTILNTNGKYFFWQDTTATGLGSFYIAGKRNADIGQSVVQLFNYGTGISGNHPVLSLTAPAMTAGQILYLTLGKGTNQSNSNESFLSYMYQGNGSDSNRLMLSFANNVRPFYASPLGRVGVMTPFPLYPLHVTGASRLDSIYNGDGTAALPTYGFNSDKDNGMYLNAANSLGFSAAGSEALRLSASDIWIKRPYMYLGAGADLFLTNEAANIFQIGNDGAATPQTIKAQDGSGSNVAGSNFIVAGGRGTGTGAGGSLIFQTSPSGGSGSSQNALVTAQTIASNGTTTFAGTVAVPDDVYAAGWNGSTNVPTKNAVYDKIETLAAGATTEGTYAPTYSALVSLSSVVGATIRYVRTGNTVTVYGNAIVTFNAGADAVFEMTLPVASNITNKYDLAGTGKMQDYTTNSGQAYVTGSIANNTAYFKFYNIYAAGNGDFSFTFTYFII